MGDELTAEDLAVLGETPEPSEGPETPEPEGEVAPEGTETEQPEVPEGGEAPKYTIEDGFIVYPNGERIPIDRFEKVYYEKKEADRKIDLLKSDPEAYFTLYPDERPQKPEPEAPQDQSFQSLGEMLITGGPYDGWTLNQVYQEDPATAIQLQTNYLNGLNETQRQAQQQEESIKTEAQKEITELSTELSRELFNGDYDTLKPEVKQKVDDKILEVITWMQKTKRGGGLLKDAYLLMNHEEIVKKARAGGAQATIDTLSRTTVPSINVGRGESGGVGAYEGMTPSQLEAEIDKMSEKESEVFLASASPGLRAKFPNLPWK